MIGKGIRGGICHAIHRYAKEKKQKIILRKIFSS